ncbi:type I restriction modification enzyme M subunit [Candidatus Scalindua japonica]|uniref:Type I restriction modification enzyme M subunit n=2 Tax=Candidatus Scalindua japonica TaxID=1284222 RepID=A0A286U0B9_9BACT|nr:type I restriction modification enzyme M subunit [Candidatus Scalindua japonica]
MRIEEFEPEKRWWKKRKESEYAWKVSVKDVIANNYNLDIKNPHIVDENHGDPKDILKEYHEIEKKIEKVRNTLKKELMDALGETK